MQCKLVATLALAADAGAQSLGQIFDMVPAEWEHPGLDSMLKLQYPQLSGCGTT